MNTDVVNHVSLQREHQSPDRFWLSRIQTYDWGTYSGVHDFNIAREGFMFLGPSGSGKSTILDAHATLMTPPKWLGFNVAAVAAPRQRTADRTLVSYVRGAWGDKTVEEGSLEAARQYLRPGSTWSVISETYRNDAGEVVTLAQVLWIKGTTTAATDVKHLYMVLQRDFNVKEMKPFAESDFNVRQLKIRMANAIIKDEFSGYQEVYRRLLGIENESALRLLHKTQSAKDLADLNAFLRDFMLDVPETFSIANDLVTQFAELNDAHNCVIEAEQQIGTLQPAQEEASRRQLAIVERNRIGDVASAIDAYVEQTKKRLIDEETQRLDVAIDGAKQQLRVLQTSADGERSKLETLEVTRLGQGGREIKQLEDEIADAELQKQDRLRKRHLVEMACGALGWPLPADASWMAIRAAEAKALIDAAPLKRRSDDEKKFKLRDEYSKQNAAFADVRREIDAMERQHSNIPARMLEVRHRLARALRIGEDKLPFAGELIEVRAEDARWQGAIERVLGGFAVSLLVDDRHYREVSNWINEEHLGARFFYFRITTASPLAGSRNPGPNSLIRKLSFAVHPYSDWIREELKSRFDYECIEDMDRFRASAGAAVTLKGQIKHTSIRHEKNDRHRIDDPSQWVLGFDNNAKLALYRDRAAELGRKLADLGKEISNLEEEQEKEAHAVQQCVTVANTTWADVDVASVAQRIDRLSAQIQKEKRARPNLVRIDGDIRTQKAVLKAAEEDVSQKVLAIREWERQLGRLDEQRSGLEEELLLVELIPSQREELDERYRSSRKEIALSSLSDITRTVERALSNEKSERTAAINDLENLIRMRFAEFIRRWPLEASGLDATMASAEDFFAKLDRLLLEGLPRFKARFAQLLHEHSSQSLSRLSSRLDLERTAVSERLEIVNDSLKTREYNAGTHLEIISKDRITEDVRAFKADLRAALSYALGNDAEHAEARFHVVKRIVQRLSSAEPADRAWRQQVLDVRQHVEFIAKELDTAGLEIEIYRGGGGKSGGQRQKLTLSCLAAALRFQLGGEDGELPRYRTVVIDEAFEKADNDFTILTMKIFESMGFQMVVATPMKAVMALEPFIGGASFVHSSSRKSSAHLPIEYDHLGRRLLLSEDLRSQVAEEAISDEAVVRDTETADAAIANA